MNSSRERRIVQPEHIVHKMANAKQQIGYKDMKNKRDSAKRFLGSLKE